MENAIFFTPRRTYLCNAHGVFTTARIRSFLYKEAKVERLVEGVKKLGLRSNWLLLGTRVFADFTVMSQKFSTFVLPFSSEVILDWMGSSFTFHGIC